MSVNYSSNNAQNAPRDTSVARPKPTRDSIVREYNSEAASYARGARLRANEKAEFYKQSAARSKERAAARAQYEAMRKEEEAIQAEKRARERDYALSQARESASLGEKTTHTSQKRRVVEPLSSQEYQEKTRKNFEHYERERAVRDPYQPRSARKGERTVIDGRGTIDSRAFNEQDIITNRVVAEEDKHEATLTTTDAKERWRTRKDSFSKNAPSIGRVGGNTAFSAFRELPPFFRVVIPVIIILIIIVIVLIIKG